MPPLRLPSISPVLLVFMATLAGCGPKVHALKQDQTVTYEALRDGKIAIAGVANRAGHDDDPTYEIERWPGMFEHGVHTAREGIDLVAPEVVADRLGGERHREVVARYGRMGDLDGEALAEIDSALAGLARYVALARMEEIGERRQRNENDKNPDPKVEQIDITLTSSRTARASFDLYDLQTRRSVWSGEISSSSDNKTTTAKPEKEKGFWGFVAGVTKANEPVYPDTPAIPEAVLAVFHDFGRALPKRK